LTAHIDHLKTSLKLVDCGKLFQLFMRGEIWRETVYHRYTIARQI